MSGILEFLKRLLIIIILVLALVGLAGIISPEVFVAIQRWTENSAPVISTFDADTWAAQDFGNNLQVDEVLRPPTLVPVQVDVVATVPSEGVIIDIIPTVPVVVSSPIVVEEYVSMGFIPVFGPDASGPATIWVSETGSGRIYDERIVNAGETAEFMLPVGFETLVVIAFTSIEPMMCRTAMFVDAPLGGLYNVDLETASLGSCPEPPPVE